MESMTLLSLLLLVGFVESCGIVLTVVGYCCDLRCVAVTLVYVVVDSDVWIVVFVLFGFEFIVRFFTPGTGF